jgi:hypothetical protein
MESYMVAVQPITTIRERRLSLRGAMLRSRYAELAYYRVMLGRATAQADRKRMDNYRECAERAGRCVEDLLNPRRAGVVVFPEIRAELRRWAEVTRRRDMPW